LLGDHLNGRNDPMLTESVDRRVWQQTRRVALTKAQVASPLARRPYDVRHSGTPSVACRCGRLGGDGKARFGKRRENSLAPPREK